MKLKALRGWLLIYSKMLWVYVAGNFLNSSCQCYQGDGTVSEIQVGSKRSTHFAFYFYFQNGFHTPGIAHPLVLVAGDWRAVVGTGLSTPNTRSDCLYCYCSGYILRGFSGWF